MSESVTIHLNLDKVGFLATCLLNMGLDERCPHRHQTVLKQSDEGPREGAEPSQTRRLRICPSNSRSFGTATSSASGTPHRPPFPQVGRLILLSFPVLFRVPSSSGTPLRSSGAIPSYIHASNPAGTRNPWIHSRKRRNPRPLSR